MDTSPLDLRVVFRPHNIIRSLSPDSDDDELVDRCGSMSLSSTLITNQNNGIYDIFFLLVRISTHVLSY